MISVVFILIHFRRPLMVLKSAFVAAVCTGLLALAGPAAAAEYRPAEYLKLDLSKALISPKRIGPEARFGPVRIEARYDEAQADSTDADLEASVWPKLPPRKTSVPGQPRSRASSPAPSRACARARSWPSATAIRWMRRRAIRGSRPGRAGPAVSATGSDSRAGFAESSTCRKTFRFRVKRSRQTLRRDPTRVARMAIAIARSED